MNTECKSESSRLGMAILIGMQVLGLVSIFLTMHLLDEIPFPSRPTLLWSLAATLSVLFPLFTAHFFALYMRKTMNWFNWWMIIVLIFGVSFLILGNTDINTMNSSSQHRRVVAFYLSEVIGGCFGALVTFGLVRRFLPTLLCREELPCMTVKRSLSIKMLFVWLTTASILSALYLNANDLNIEIFPSRDISLPLGILIAIFWSSIIGLFIWLPTLRWIQHLQPFWFSIVCIAVLLSGVTVAAFGIGSVLSRSYESQLAWRVYAISSDVGLYILLCGCWLQGCRLAGLLPASIHPRGERRGWLRKSLFAVHWLTQRTAWLATAFAISFGIVWTVVHFAMGGDERDMNQFVKGSLAEHDDWLDRVNSHWEEGVTPDSNSAVSLVKLLNPLGEMDTNEFYRKLGLTPNEIKKVSKISLDQWFNTREFHFRESLELKLDELEKELGSRKLALRLGSTEEPIESSQGPKSQGVSGDEQVIDELEIETKYIRYLLAGALEFKSFTRAPWTREDCSLVAEFLEAHQDVISQLHEISTQQHFYSPWIESQNEFKSDFSDIHSFGEDLLRPAFELLEMSAMYHIGSGNIDRAFKDWLAISRFSRPEFYSRHVRGLLNLSNPAEFRTRRIALQIAFDENTTTEQIHKMLTVVAQHHSVSVSQFDLEVRDAVIRRRTLNTFINPSSRVSTDVFGTVNPCFYWFQSNPSTIDWRAFKKEFDDTVSKKESLYRSALRGDIGILECDRQLADLSVIENSSFGIGPYYNIFGNQLLAWLRGPKYKGNQLAKIFAYETVGFIPNWIYSERAIRDMTIIAIALRAWKAKYGRYPDRLEELAPALLPEIPKDAFNDANYRYKLEGDTFRLYSVFRNQTDDGGNDGDLLFNEPYNDLKEAFLDSY